MRFRWVPYTTRWQQTLLEPHSPLALRGRQPVFARPHLLSKIHIGGGGYVVEAKPEKPIFHDFDCEKQNHLLLSPECSIEITTHGDRCWIGRAPRAAPANDKKEAKMRFRRFAHNLRRESDFVYFFARNPLKSLDSKK